MKIKLSYVCFVALFLTIKTFVPNRIYADNLICNAKKSHDRQSNHISFKYDSLITDTFQYNTQNVEDFTGIKESVIKGENHSQQTPKDVDGWYEFISTPNRSYRMSFNFYGKGNNICTIVNAPPKTFRLCETREEYIINKSHQIVFYTNHKEKFVHAIPFINPIAKDPCPLIIQFINPFVQLYPLAFIDDIENVTYEEQGEYIKITWINPNQETRVDLLSIEALLDPSQNYAAVKTLSKMWRNWHSYRYVLSEHTDFINTDKICVPKKINAVQFQQWDSETPLSSQKVMGMNIIKSNVPLSFNEIRFDSIQEFGRRYIMSLNRESLSNQCFDSDVFWPVAPNGYKYNDERYFTSDFYEKDIKEQLKIDAIAGGVGPHKFPLTIEPITTSP